MRGTIAAGLLLLCALSTTMSAQSSNASLGGTAADSTGALIPGVTVTATNSGTGIVSTVVTNETGAYQFAALQPGNYKVTAELPGFQSAVYNNVDLGISQVVRLNFRLQVGNVTQQVEVAVAADTLIATTSASIGAVLPIYKVNDLPLLSRDVMNLIGTTAGVRGAVGNLTFAGAPQGSVNTTRDGISVQQGRYANGAYSTVFTSPDMVEEVRVIVTPVDAETARGSGQVQLQTRSGTNNFRGSVFWADRNTAWDANSFSNNFNGVKPDYLNRNQFGARFGGPIKKNKAFFFFLYEGMRTVQRNVTFTPVLTDTARQGSFRFFPGVQSASATASNPTVDLAGAPLTPRGATGPLATFNVFNRDPLRQGPDPSGMIQRLLAVMPHANDFTSAAGNTIDGLNIAGYRYVRRGIGTENFQGLGQNINRNQANLRIDYQINARHKFSGVATRERTWADSDVAAWPDGPNSALKRQPQVYTGSFVSTLSPTLLNEFRVGLRRDRLKWTKAFDLAGPEGDEGRKWLGNTAGGYPFIFRPTLFANNIVNFAGNGGVSNVNPLWTFSNNLNWTRGRHSLKGGVELRYGATNEWTAQSTIPRVDLGPTTTTGGRQYPCASCGIPVQGIDSTAFVGLSNADAVRARDLLTDLAGSVGSINQQFDVLDPLKIVFEDYTTSYPRRWDDLHQNEASWFFKDDWKLRSNLTVNLGLRWDWYGVPYSGDGLGATAVGGGNGLFSITGGFDHWFQSGNFAPLMQTEFVGKNSPNPKKTLYPNDWNNFGPAVGISWSLPWFGKDKTVLRAGYGVNYQGLLAGGGGLQLDFAVGYFPGYSWIATHQVTASAETDLRNLVLPIPERPASGQLKPIPVTEPVTNSNVIAFDNHLVSPYIQNFNFELQRQLANNLTLEVRYVGTKGTKLFPPGNFALNINPPNAIENGILDAFKVTQAGGDAALFNQMLNGFNFGGVGTVNGTSLTGSAALRQFSGTRTFLANGDPAGLANYLARTAPAGGKVGDYVRRNGFPENFIVTNPQLGTGYGGTQSALLWTNAYNSTYNSFNLAVTKRLSHGFTNQATYTWSKTLGTNVVDPRVRGSKTLQGQHRTHDFRSNGTYELPFGPGRPLLANAPGWLTRVVERWQLGAAFNMTTGGPIALNTGLSNPYGLVNNFPDAVTTLPKSLGQVKKSGLAPGVVTYFDGLGQVTDPGRASLTTAQTLNTASTNFAITDASGKIILQNPATGKIGNLGDNYFEGPGVISLDANLLKTFRISESKEFVIRLDAVNVLNHPNWAAPNNSINSTSFGRINLPTGGNRQFVFNARMNF